MTDLKKFIIIYSFLILAALSAMVFAAVVGYLFIFGTLLEMNVSSLNGAGPEWPFTVCYSAAVVAAIATPVGIVWAFLAKRRLTAV